MYTYRDVAYCFYYSNEQESAEVPAGRPEVVRAQASEGIPRGHDDADSGM
jgi:hypothetical protein